MKRAAGLRSKPKLVACLAFCLAAPLAAQHRIELFAGGANRSGSPARDVALGFIQGVAHDPSGLLVFAETGSNLIRRIGRDGALETIAGTGDLGFSGDGGLATRAALNGPAHPRYDGAGNLYFADVANARIRRVDPRGVITSIAGTGIPLGDGMDLEGPALARSIGWINGFAVDRAGRVYFSERETRAIRRISGGRLEVIAGSPGDGCYCSDGDGGPAVKAHLGEPGSLALDPSGNLFVIESFGHIRRITPDGNIDKFAGYGPQPPPRGPAPADDGIPAINIYIYGRAALATGPDGTLYVADSGFSQPPRIRRIAPSGIADTAPGSSGRAVSDLAIGSDGSVAIVAYTIVSVLADGEFRNMAGDSPKPAPDGIRARDAWLLSPSAIAANSKGDLYIAETGACAIRKVGADGVLRTAAGTGRCADSGALQPATGSDLAPPVSLTIDRQDRLWVCDKWGNAYRIAPDGSISAAPLPPLIGATAKVAIDSKDRLYVLGMFSLARVRPDGNVETIVNPPSAPGVPSSGFGPTSMRAIGVDPAGNVYFTGRYLGEAGADSIFRVNDDASFTRVYGGSWNAWALAVDGRGRIWQADGGVSVIDAEGARGLGLAAAGYAGDGGPAQSARMSTTGIALLPSGEMFVLDSNRIRKISGDDPKVRPAIASGGVVNAASYEARAIAPGEVIAIFGSGFATGPAVAAIENNRLPVALGHTRVFIGGRSAAILAVTPTQVNAIVPAGLTPGQPVDVVVQFDTAASAPARMPVAATVFGLATLDASGSGSAAVLNQDGTLNTASNPAPRGSIVSFFGVGAGESVPELFSGAIVVSTPYPKPAALVTATIGGQPAELTYVGAAPYLPEGVTQLNARIPPGIPAGAQTVIVNVDGTASRPVTVSVR